MYARNATATGSSPSSAPVGPASADAGNGPMPQLTVASVPGPGSRVVGGGRVPTLVAPVAPVAFVVPDDPVARGSVAPAQLTVATNITTVAAPTTTRRGTGPRATGTGP